MKNALDFFDEIASRLHGKKCMLLLDFDGTLAPLVPNPSDAKASPQTFEVLQRCIDTFSVVAIVSGRKLTDIAQFVPIQKIWAAGSHGLEWHTGEESHSVETPPAQVQAIESVRKALTALTREYEGTIFEEKNHCVAVNYRALSEQDAEAFRAHAHEITAPYESTNTLRVMDGLHTFEAVPALDWNKGECSKMLLRLANEQEHTELVPMYIGDAITDEDAFRALRDGITIRVGEDTESAAEYFVPAQEDVDEVLTRLCNLASHS